MLAMKNIAKKISAALIIVVFLAVGASALVEKPAEAQVYLCSSCCDINPYTGGARVRCSLIQTAPCGASCYCNGVAGTGFTCY